MLRRFARINSVPHYRAENTGVAQYNILSTSRDPEPVERIEDDAIPSLAPTIEMPQPTFFIHPHGEYQYLNLIHDIIEENNEHIGRNGRTISIFGAAMVFSLDQGLLPLLTTKQMAWKTCLKELLWFIQGKTDNRLLQSAGVHIWDDNASPEFMESRGLAHYAEGDLGPIYGHQWRHFNAKYDTCESDYTGQGVDQLAEIIRCLKDPVERFSRRLIMSAWNPCQLNEMALPPCHILANLTWIHKIDCLVLCINAAVMLV